MKITIIGAGIIGSTSAYYLAKSGHEVVVIDRQDGPGLETSFANAGMLTPSMADPWNAPGILGTLLSSLGSAHSSFMLRPKAVPSMIGWGVSFLLNSRAKLYYRNLYRSADMANYSMEMMSELQQQLNIEFSHITTGAIKIFRDQKSMDKLVKLSRKLSSHNVTYQAASGSELLKIEPSLAPVIDNICGGVFFPNDQAGNAYQFTCEIEKAAKNYGANFRYGISVDKIVRTGATISKLETSEGEFFADRFILCAGSYSTLLAKSAGLKVPVRPAKGYSITVPLNGWNGGPGMPLIDDVFHAAISPLGDVLRVAGTAEFAGYDQNLTRERLDNLYNLLDELYPDFAKSIDRTQVTEWAGLRPLTVDGSPYIGKTPVDNLYLNTGHGPLGWTLAAGSAKMLSDIIDGKKTRLDQRAYSLSRA